MKKLIHLLLIIFLGLSVVISCKSNEDIADEEQANTENITAKRYEIINIIANGAVEGNEYDASIDGITSKAHASENNKLAIIIPAEVNIGTHQLKIPELGVNVEAKIEDIVLTESPKSIFEKYYITVDNLASTLDDSPINQEYKTAINNIKTVLANAPENDLIEAAKFHKVNEAYFTNLYNNPTPKGTLLDPDEAATIARVKLKYWTLALIGSVVMLEVVKNPYAQISAGLGIFISLKNCLYYKHDFIKEATILVDPSLYIKSQIEFTSDQQKNLNLNFSRRGIIADDTKVNLPAINDFFSTNNDFTTYHSRLNKVLKWLNNNIPFCNLPISEPTPIPSSSNAVSTPISQQTFSKTKFTVNNNNIEIVNISFNSEGKINAKFKIKDNNITEPISTKLNMNYTDDYNNSNKSFDILVKPDNGFKLEGNWRLTAIDDEETDMWHVDTPTGCPGQAEDVFLSGTVVFTDNTMKININEKYRYYNYNSQCQVIEYKEPTGWRTITANHNNTITNNKISLTNGSGINHDNFTWNFNNGVITIIDSNHITLDYSYYDGHENVESHYKMARQ